MRFRKFTRAGGSLTIADGWGTVTLDTAYGSGGFDSATRTQRYTFSRSAGTDGGTASGAVAADAIVLDYGVSGNGLYEVNAIDGAYALNSPYLQFIKWTTHPKSGQSVRLRLGNLRGITGQADEYGLYAGSGVTDADQYILLSSYTNRLNNMPMQWREGGTLGSSIDAANGIEMRAVSATNRARGYTFANSSGNLLFGMYGTYSASIKQMQFLTHMIGTEDTQLDFIMESKDVAGIYLGAWGWNAGATAKAESIIRIAADYDTSSYISLTSPQISVDGSVQFYDAAAFIAGSAGAPAFHFGYADTGLYGPADGQVAIACNGTQRLLADPSGVSVTGTLSSTGAATVFGLTVDGTAPGINVGDATVTTGGCYIQLGNARAGDGNAYIDLIATNDTYTDYSLRLIRNAGLNGSTLLSHRGTGTLIVEAVENATIQFETNNVARLTIDSANVDAAVRYARGGTNGYLFVPLTTPVNLTDTVGTPWAGAATKAAGTYSFDMSVAANLNMVTSSIKAYAVLLSGQWAAANGNSWAGVRPRGGLGATQSVQIRAQVAAMNSEVCGVCACDANGDLDVVVNNATMSVCVCRLIGYFI